MKGAFTMNFEVKTKEFSVNTRNYQDLALDKNLVNTPQINEVKKAAIGLLENYLGQYNNVPTVGALDPDKVVANTKSDENARVYSDLLYGLYRNNEYDSCDRAVAKHIVNILLNKSRKYNVCNIECCTFGTNQVPVVTVHYKVAASMNKHNDYEITFCPYRSSVRRVTRVPNQFIWKN